jgi:hypothetical protein
MPGQTGQTVNIEIDDTAILDSAGNSMPPLLGQDYYFHMFDDTAPDLEAFSPVSGESDVPYFGNVTLTFNEVVNVTGSMVVDLFLGNVLDSSKTRVVLTQHQFVVDNHKVTLIEPLKMLSVNAVAVSCYVRIPSGVFRDATGNGYSGNNPKDFEFHLIDISQPVLSRDTALFDGPLSPVNNATGVSGTEPIILRFNEPMQAGYGNIYINPLDGSDVSHTIAVGDSTLVDFFSTHVTIQCEGGLDDGAIGRTYEVVLQKGVLVDTAAKPNDFGGFSAGEYTFRVADISPPVVKRTTPKNVAVGVKLNSTIEITFNEAVHFGSTNRTILLSPSDAGSVIEIESNDASQVMIAFENPFVVIIAPTNGLTSALQTQTYTLNIKRGAFEDTGGNLMNELTYTFTVEDVVGPSVVGSHPLQGATNVLRQNDIKLEFDQPIQAGAGRFVIEQALQVLGAGEVWVINATSENVRFEGNKVFIRVFPNFLLFDQESELYVVKMESTTVTDTAAQPNEGILNSILPNSDSALVHILSFTVVNAFQNVTVVSSTVAAGLNTKLTVSFTTLVAISNFDSLVLSMPQERVENYGFKFSPSNLQSNFELTTPANNLYFVYGERDTQIVVQKIGGTSIQPYSDVAFEVSGIQLPRVLGYSGDFVIQTMDVQGAIRDTHGATSGLVLENKLAPSFDDGNLTFSIAESVIYNECNEDIVVIRNNFRTRTVGDCPPAVLNSRQLVGVIKANNSDWIPNEILTYRIVSGSGAALFEIDALSGALFSTQLMDAEALVTAYTLLVEAKDGSAPFFFETAWVDIFVEDLNDHSPQFILLDRAYIDVVVLKSAAKNDDVLTTVSATDADTGANAQMEFFLDSSLAGDFAIQPLTGELTIARVNALVPRQFEVFVKDSPTFPTESRVATVLVNLQVITGANIVVDAIQMKPGASFSAAAYLKTMNDRICGGNTCVVELWEAPGVVKGDVFETVDTTTAFGDYSGSVGVKYYVRAHSSAMKATIVREQLFVAVYGISAEDIAILGLGDAIEQAAEEALISQSTLTSSHIFRVTIGPLPITVNLNSVHGGQRFGLYWILDESISSDQAVILSASMSSLIVAGIFKNIAIPNPQHRHRRGHEPLALTIEDPMLVEEPFVTRSQDIPAVSESAPFSVSQIEEVLEAAISNLSEDELAESDFVSTGFTLGDTSVGADDDFLGINNDDDDDGDDTFGSITRTEGITLVTSASLVFIAIAVWFLCCCCGCCGKCKDQRSDQLSSYKQQVSGAYPRLFSGDYPDSPSGGPMGPEQQWNPYDAPVARASMASNSILQPFATPYYDPFAAAAYAPDPSFQQGFGNEHDFIGNEYSNAFGIHAEYFEDDDYINAGPGHSRYTDQDMM